MPCQLCGRDPEGSTLYAVPISTSAGWMQRDCCTVCARRHGALCPDHYHPHRLEGDRTVCDFCEIDRRAERVNTERASAFAHTVLGAQSPPIPAGVAEFLTDAIDRQVLERRAGPPSAYLARLLLDYAAQKGCSVEHVTEALTTKEAVAELLSIPVPTVRVTE